MAKVLGRIRPERETAIAAYGLEIVAYRGEFYVWDKQNDINLSGWCHGNRLAALQWAERLIMQTEQP